MHFVLQNAVVTLIIHVLLYGSASDRTHLRKSNTSDRVCYPETHSRIAYNGAIISQTFIQFVLYMAIDACYAMRVLTCSVKPA